MFCSKCGSPNPDGSAFCAMCGQQFSGVAPRSAAPGAASGVPPATPAGAAAATPQAGVSPHWRPAPPTLYAGFWLRFVAYLVDGFILAVPVIILAALVFVAAGGVQIMHGIHPGEDPSPQLIAFFIFVIGGVVLVAFAGKWLYYAYFESSSWQGTPGKKILNLIVTDLNGNPVTFGRASGRFFSRIITGLIPMGIGYILAGFTEKKQALHDMIASCLVLRKY